MGRRHLAGDAGAEIDPRSAGRTLPFRADGSQFVLGAHHHDRASLPVEKVQRAGEDGFEHLFEVEPKVDLLARVDHYVRLPQAVGEGGSENSLIH